MYMIISGYVDEYSYAAKFLANISLHYWNSENGLRVSCLLFMLFLDFMTNYNAMKTWRTGLRNYFRMALSHVMRWCATLFCYEIVLSTTPLCYAGGKRFMWLLSYARQSTKALVFCMYGCFRCLRTISGFWYMQPADTCCLMLQYHNSEISLLFCLLCTCCLIRRLAHFKRFLRENPDFSGYNFSDSVCLRLRMSSASLPSFGIVVLIRSYFLKSITVQIKLH